ncbi:hypothetical protein SRHO_G00068830 [Serrasalmus rhombeus]
MYFTLFALIGFHLAKTAGLSQSTIRPAVRAASPHSSGVSSPSSAPPDPTQTPDITALRSEIVHAVVAEIRDVMNEHYSNIKSDLSALKMDLLCDFADLKSDVATLQTTVDGVERALSACTDDVSQLQTTVASLTKTVADLEAKCDDLESRSRRQNIRIIGIPEDGSFTLSTSSVSTLLKDALQLPDLPQIDRAHQSLAPKPSSGQPSRPIIARLHCYEDCVNILKQALSAGRSPDAHSLAHWERRSLKCGIFLVFTPCLTRPKEATVILTVTAYLKSPREHVDGRTHGYTCILSMD